MMSWKAKIWCKHEGKDLRIDSFYEDLVEFAEKVCKLEEKIIVRIELVPVDRSDLLALQQKSMLKKPWRIDCKYCGGSGWREPTGEAHRAAGLIECDLCQPMPFRLINGGLLPDS